MAVHPSDVGQSEALAVIGEWRRLASTRMAQCLGTNDMETGQLLNYTQMVLAAMEIYIEAVTVDPQVLPPVDVLALTSGAGARAAGDIEAIAFADSQVKWDRSGELVLMAERQGFVPRGTSGNGVVEVVDIIGVIATPRAGGEDHASAELLHRIGEWAGAAGLLVTTRPPDNATKEFCEGLGFELVEGGKGDMVYNGYGLVNAMRRQLRHVTTYGLESALKRRRYQMIKLSTGAADTGLGAPADAEWSWPIFKS